MKDIVLILLLGVGAGLFASRIGQPTAVAQVLVGLIFGPPLLGWISLNENLKIIGELGVLLLLGMAGLHLKLDKLLRTGWQGFCVAFLGMGLCFIGGYSFTLWWGSPGEEALYVGVVLTATSIGISVQVLQQYNLVDKDIGRIVIVAAVIDDIAALYLLSITHDSLTEAFLVSKVILSMIFAALMFGLIFIVCRLLARFLSAWIILPVLRMLFSLVIIISFAWLTQWLGYSLVVGSFIAGLGLGEGLLKSHQDELIKQYDNLVVLLVPFFFVSIGSQAEWQVLSDNGMPTLVAGLIIIALTGKTLGGYLGSGFRGEFYKPFLIGLSMVPRGEVALVIASIGFEQGHISHHMLVALMLMAIVAAIAGPVLMTPFVKKHAKKTSVN